MKLVLYWSFSNRINVWSSLFYLKHCHVDCRINCLNFCVSAYSDFARFLRKTFCTRSFHKHIFSNQNKPKHLKMSHSQNSVANNNVKNVFVSTVVDVMSIWNLYSRSHWQSELNNNFIFYFSWCYIKCVSSAQSTHTSQVRKHPRDEVKVWGITKYKFRVELIKNVK